MCRSMVDIQPAAAEIMTYNVFSGTLNPAQSVRLGEEKKDRR